MRRIVQLGEPILKARAAEVPSATIKTKAFQRIISEMKDALAAEPLGVAIAAPQIGESYRLFVVAGKVLRKKDGADPDESKGDQVYINPVLVKISKKQKLMHEGCLSLKGKWGMVPRSEKATVRALDEQGAPFTRGATGLLAHIFQHELDHLEGIVYTDKAEELFDDDQDNV